MNHIEVFICLLLLFMAVPDFCRKLARPALVFPVFVLVGITLRPVVGDDLSSLLNAVGEMGFLLLLFEVGHEIDLPSPRQMLRPLRYAAIWVIVQYPVIVFIASLAGLNVEQCLVAAAALTACSVGMAYSAWKSYPGLEAATSQRVLQIMVLLETIAIVTFAAESAFLEHGWSWQASAKLFGAVLAIILVGYLARHFRRLFQLILETTTHWRTHMLVLLIFLVCAIGHRLGLSAPKTAFFLGLFMSRAQHDGKSIEEYIAPISRQLLIPLFFVSLGMKVPYPMLLSVPALLAFGAAAMLLAGRYLLHRRALPLGGDARTFLLLCPNLTIAALGAVVLSGMQADEASFWVLLTGLFMTIGAVLLLPRAGRRLGPQTASAPE